MNNIDLNAVQQAAAAIKEMPGLGVKKWAANINWQDGTENSVLIRNFAPIVIDEPAQLGGSDKGPNPVEYLLAGVVSCFAITFEVFASQQGIKLDKVSANIEADLNVAVFLGLEEGSRGILNPVIKLNAATSAPVDKVKEIANLALSVSPVLNSLNTKVELIVE